MVVSPELVLVTVLVAQFRSIDKQDIVVLLVLLYYDDARSYAHAKKQVGRKLNYRVHKIIPYQIFAYLLFGTSTIKHTRKLYDGASASLVEVVEHVHGEGKVGLRCRGKHTCRTVAHVVDKNGISLALPFCGVRGIAHDSVKTLSEVVGSGERIAQLDVEFGIVHIMQEHVYTAKIVSCGVDFLTVKLNILGFITSVFHKFHQQRTRTTSRVVNLAYVWIVVRCYAGQHLAYLLWCEKLATALTGFRRVHLHQKLVSVTYGVDAVVGKLLAELHVAHSCQYGSYAFVAHLDRVAYARAVDDEVGKQALYLLLAFFSCCTCLYGTEHLIQGFI